jgi:hypothetical protein
MRRRNTCALRRECQLLVMGGTSRLRRASRLRGTRFIRTRADVLDERSEGLFCAERHEDQQRRRSGEERDPVAAVSESKTERESDQDGNHKQRSTARPGQRFLDRSSHVSLPPKTRLPFLSRPSIPKSQGVTAEEAQSRGPSVVNDDTHVGAVQARGRILLLPRQQRCARPSPSRGRSGRRE